MLSYTEEIRKYIEEMKERKDSHFTWSKIRFGSIKLLIAILLVAILIIANILFERDSAFDGVAILIATASFCLAGVKNSECYMIKRMSRDKDLEKFIGGLEQEAKKQDIFIRDIQVLENNGHTYLKIYYNLYGKYILKDVI